jgi:hypothetical protein
MVEHVQLCNMLSVSNTGTRMFCIAKQLIDANC